ALDAAAGELPHAVRDGHRTGVRYPRLDGVLDRLVEIGLPTLLPRRVQQANDTARGGDDDARPVTGDTHQARAADHDAGRNAALGQVALAQQVDAAVPATGDDDLVTDGHVANCVRER